MRPSTTSTSSTPLPARQGRRSLLTGRMDGVDLMPYFTGERAGLPHDTLFWREGHQQSVLHKGWKMIRADRPDKRWLFNLVTDPTEQVNLAAEEPAKVG